MRKLSRRELAKRAVEAHWQRTNAVISLKVDGTSMGDTIPDGTTIQVAFSERPKVRRGDIVYIRRGELRVVHRLTFTLGSFCLEKGDANRYARPCMREAILGIVVGHSPGFRMPVTTLRSAGAVPPSIGPVRLVSRNCNTARRAFWHTGQQGRWADRASALSKTRSGERSFSPSVYRFAALSRVPGGPLCRGSILTGWVGQETPPSSAGV